MLGNEKEGEAKDEAAKSGDKQEEKCGGEQNSAPAGAEGVAKAIHSPEPEEKQKPKSE